MEKVYRGATATEITGLGAIVTGAVATFEKPPRSSGSDGSPN